MAWWRTLRSRLSPGTAPLRQYLLVWMIAPQLVLWVAAAFMSYQVALHHANLALDRSLYQSSRALARQVKPLGSGLLIDLPRAARDILETDPDEQVYYMVSSPPGQFILGNRVLPAPPGDLARAASGLDGEPRFYDDALKVDARRMGVRVVALYLAYGEADNPQTMLVQIAKSRVSRDALASRILGDIAIPLVLLVMAMSVGVWWGVRKGLTPLSRLQQAVGSRAPGDHNPIALGPVPEEVEVVVSALNDLLGRVQGSVASQRRFISDAAHQLRTPLAGLKSQTELALKATADPELKVRLQRVHESATRSAHLVNQLLTLARAEPESMDAMGQSRFDLHRLVQELTAELVPRALQARVDLGLAEDERPDDLPAPAAPCMVQGNALLIREALFNVIDNAIRYAGAGAEVTLSLHREGAQVCVRIDDTGPGIPEAHHEAVFRRFFRATHEGTGCGLGLAIVREIAERHGGSVQLASRMPQGLSVQVRLPLA
jgi:two-component system, OmpR family, sensor histidine kinase TctE